MLVDNYYNSLLESYCGNNIKGLTLVSIYNDEGVRFDGLKSLSWTDDEARIVFGPDNTKPTRHDYALKGKQIQGIIQQNTKHFYELLEDGIKITKVINIYNSNNDSVVIGEMAWYYLVLYGAAGSFIMLDRTIFDEPITLSPGESKQINYSLYFKYGS